MRRFIPFVCTLFFGFYVSAQNQAIEKNPFNPDMIQGDINVPQGTHPAIPRNVHSRAVSFIQLGTSYNIYSILLNGQNMVMYNSDINTVTFIHRQNNGGAGGSGVLTFDVSTDGGLNWTINQGPLTPGIVSGSAPTDGCRYPSATIYNPTGNTNPNNAYIVGMGPALVPNASWGYLFQVSSMLDGSNVSENYPMNPGSPYAFHPYGLSITPNGTAWSLSTMYNNSGNSALDTLTFSTFFLNKGTFNSSANKFDWVTVDTFKPNYFRYISSFSGMPVNFATTWNMAFSPDGNTGYVVVIGAEKGGLDTVPKPIVWKTSDGGNTWNKLPDFDFGSLQTMIDHIIETQDGKVRPFFSGADAVVDNQGRLHIFAEVFSQFTTSPDSVAFFYSNPQSDGTITAFLMDVNTTNGTDWDAIFIDSIRNSDGLFPNGSGGNLSIDSRVQISRTEEGSKIFYSWSATDVAMAGTTDNILPNVLGRGLDIATGDLTFIKNFTENTAFDGSVYYPTLSPVSISGGDDFDYEMPIVFAEPGASALDAPQYYFIKGAGFNNGDFGSTSPVGIEATKASSIYLWPNPTDGLVNLAVEQGQGSLEVYNTLGQLVLTQTITDKQETIDLSRTGKGLYMIKIKTGVEVRTLKVLVK